MAGTACAASTPASLILAVTAEAHAAPAMWCPVVASAINRCQHALPYARTIRIWVYSFQPDPIPKVGSTFGRRGRYDASSTPGPLQ